MDEFQNYTSMEEFPEYDPEYNPEYNIFDDIEYLKILEAKMEEDEVHSWYCKEITANYIIFENMSKETRIVTRMYINKLFYNE